jgi:hypothetical protein
MHSPTTPESERVTDDMRGRRTAGLVLVLIAAFIGVAIAKPWGSPVASPSVPLASLGTGAASVPPSSPTATGTAVPTPATPTPAVATTDVFGIAVPPPATATWSAIRWRRLAPDDRLRLVRSVLGWRGGFIAVGSAASGGVTTTPVWTSRDGGTWMPVPFDMPTTFWPGLQIVGIAEVPSGLVALTLLDGSYQCGSACPIYIPALPLMAWTSPDGRSWTPNTGPDFGQPSTWHGPPLIAAGPAGLVVASPPAGLVVASPPAGLVVASPEGQTRLATSVDGIHWRTLPASALPAGITLRAIVGTATGYTAVGYLPVHADHFRAVAVRSLDGITWSGPFPLPVVSATGVVLPGIGSSWAANGLVAAGRGLIATGIVMATPGASLWWQSVNGRVWLPLLNWPLGPTTCQGEGCRSQPAGSLVGDGHRLIVVRGGTDGGAWTSLDGLGWQQVPVTGDIPAAQATQAVLLPGGVLLSDGTTTWFGEAVTK